MRAAWVPLLVLASCGGGGGSADASGGADGGPTGPGGPAAPGGTAGPPAIERLDPSAECDDLVPDRAAPAVEIEWTQPPGACGAAISDGTGHVAVPARSGDKVTWQIFTPSGGAGRSLAASALVPEPSGWHGLGVVTLDPNVPVVAVVHRTFSPAGDLLRESPATAAPAQVRVDGWALAQDPAGGCFTAVAETDASHNHWSSVEGQRFDPAGAPGWTAGLRFGSNDQHTVAFIGAGVSISGESLTLWQHAAQLDAWWIDGAGKEVATEQRAESYAGVVGSDALRAHDLQLLPLLDGGLAVRADGALRRVYPHLATRSQALPGWLAERADWIPRLTRGNRGYALFPPPGQASPDCSQSLELRAASGRLCGRVVLPPGAACTTGAVDQGWDGTVVQQRAQDACRYRFWPGLLAR